VYEDRRRESLRLLRESEGRRAQVAEVVADLDGKLTALEDEREELKAFQEVDRKRRAMEWLTLDRDLADTRRAIEALEKERCEASAAGAVAAATADEARAAAEAAAGQARGLSTEREALVREKDEAAAKRRAAVEALARLDLEVSEAAEARSRTEAERARLAEEEDALEGRLAAAQATLAASTSAAVEREAEEAAARRELSELTRRMATLYQRRGRSQQFASAQERDVWLRREGAALDAAAEAKAGALRKEEERAAALRRDEAAGRARADAAREAMASVADRAAASRRRRTELEDERDRLAEARRAAWRAQEDDARARAALADEVRARQERLERTVPREVNRGLASVRRLAQEHALPGVHGTVLELIDCAEHLQTAVETAAGGALLHVVVDSDETAARLVQLLAQERGGRVTFIPLNRVRSEPVSFPDKWGDGVVSLQSLLSYDARFERAIAHVFGRAAVCKDLDVATAAARETRLNCLTMQGDQVSRRGALTGGFHDARRSRVSAARGLREAQARVAALGEAAAGRDVILQRVERDLTAALGALERLKVESGRASEGVADRAADVDEGEAAAREAAAAASAAERACEAVRADLTDLRARTADLEAEIGAPWGVGLSPEEDAELARLQSRERDLQAAANAALAAAVGARAEAEAAEGDLSGNLGRRQAELAARRAAVAATEVATDSTEVVERRLAEARAAAMAAAERAAAVAARLQELDDAAAEPAKAEEKALAEATAAEAAADDARRRGDRVAHRRSAALARRDDLVRRIRALGSVSADAFQEMHAMTPEELAEGLRTTAAQLAAMGPVNQKALDQYDGFSEQRKELRNRLDKLIEGDGKVRKLIGTLDLRKHEAVERTFKQVAKAFRETFAQLAPGSRAELVMVRRVAVDGADGDAEMDGDGRDGEGDGVGADAGGVLERYSGVKVRVSFGLGETLVLRQLSGGQKTLVALALIFAIQRCDPAPFYLFDEIDAALDPQYRATVAALLKQQAHDPTAPSQFICTTFHPQLAGAADRLYGVSHAHRVSTVDAITRGDALRFLQAGPGDRDAARDASDAVAGGGRGGVLRKRRAGVEVEEAAEQHAEDAAMGEDDAVD